MSSVESNKMFRKTLSQTLNSEVSGRKNLVSFKRWSDTLRPPFRCYVHKLLKKYLEWWYGKPIYLHLLPIEKQVENVRKAYGTKGNVVNIDRATNYVWEGDGDWHQ